MTQPGVPAALKCPVVPITAQKLSFSKVEQRKCKREPLASPGLAALGIPTFVCTPTRFRR